MANYLPGATSPNFSNDKCLSDRQSKNNSELQIKLFSCGMSEFYTFWLVLGPHMWRNNIWIVTAEGTTDDMHIWIVTAEGTTDDMHIWEISKVI